MRQVQQWHWWVAVREAKCFVDGQEVAHLKAGQFAGERSLLRGEPRGADVVVVSRVCYAAFLDQTAFEKCLGPIAEVLKRSGHQTRRENLQQLKVLGVGSFGTVKLVKETDTGAVRLTPQPSLATPY